VSGFRIIDCNLFATKRPVRNVAKICNESQSGSLTELPGTAGKSFLQPPERQAFPIRFFQKGNLFSMDTFEQKTVFVKRETRTLLRIGRIRESRNPECCQRAFEAIGASMRKATARSGCASGNIDPAAARGAGLPWPL
jgi:hypothetical protein